MKKILLSTMIFSLIFAANGFVLAQELGTDTQLYPADARALVTAPAPTMATATEPALEKISHPGELNLFERIKKIGTALWGVRKNNGNRPTPSIKSENKPEQNKLEQKRPEQNKPEQKRPEENRAATSNMTATTTGKALEKIAHPGELSLFEKIVKIGTALWGVRKMDNRIGNRQVAVKPIAVQCVREAIDKKDASLKTAISAQSQVVLSALDSRNSCQKAALDKTIAKDQFDANKICVDTYQKSVKDNNKILEKARNDAWKIYRDNLKVCSLLQKENKATSTDIISTSSIVGEQDGEIVINDGEDMKE